MIGVAILLLVVGIALIVVEVLIPSFGLLSMLSVAALVGSIVLAFGESTGVGIAFLIGTLALAPAAIVAGFYLLNNTRFGDRILLKAPDTKAAVDAIYEDNTRLVGQRGVALTPLRPAGTVDFRGERVSVVTEGEPVDANTPVRVLHVEGNRIVVAADSFRPETPRDIPPPTAGTS